MASQFGRLAHDPAGAEIMRVWSRRGDDQLVSLPVIEEIGTVAQGIQVLN